MGLLLRAAGLLALIAWTVRDWIDWLLHPDTCTGTGICLDLRGLPFELTVTFVGPVIVLLVMLSWRWRGPRLWPLAVVAAIDASAILVTGLVAIDLVRYRTESVPPGAVAPFLILVPASVTLVLGINLLRPVRLKPTLAACTAGCVLLGALMWLYTLRPVPAG